MSKLERIIHDNSNGLDYILVGEIYLPLIAVPEEKREIGFYADWKLSQPSVTEPDEVEEEYKKVIATLPQKQEETITKYCDQIFNSGAETEEFFYRLGLRDGMKLRKNVKMVLKQLSE